MGTAQDCLGMDETEAALVEIRVSLAMSIRARRKPAKITQTALAKQAGTTQARVAKAEHGNSEISLDLCMRVIFVLGAIPEKIAQAIAE